MSNLTKKQATTLVGIIDTNIGAMIKTGATTLGDLRAVINGGKVGRELLEAALVKRVVDNNEYTGRKMPKVDGADQQDVFKMKTTSDAIDQYRSLFAKIETNEDAANWTFKFGWDGLTGIVNACHIQRVTSTGGNGKVEGNEKPSTETTTVEEWAAKGLRLYGLNDCNMALALLAQAQAVAAKKPSKLN